MDTSEFQGLKYLYGQPVCLKVVVHSATNVSTGLQTIEYITVDVDLALVFSIKTGPYTDNSMHYTSKDVKVCIQSSEIPAEVCIDTNTRLFISGKTYTIAEYSVHSDVTILMCRHVSDNIDESI
jgi:hypothetical protein